MITARSIILLATVVALCGLSAAAEIHEAARNGDLEKVKKLLAADPRLADAQDDDGLTPLSWATRGVHVEVAKYLMEHGADVTIPNARQVIPLHSAAFRGVDELVPLMILRGANVDAKLAAGMASLHLAVMGGHVQTARFLLSHGAALEITDRLGSTPLLMAASFGQKKMVQVFLSHGAVVDRTNSRGDTPLTVAHREGHEEIVTLLIEKGADKTQMKRHARPSGAYLGEKPPGKKPVLFAPRIVSTERSQLNAVFSPDGREFYFTQRRPGGSSIMEMRMDGSRWSRPMPVGFSSRHADVDHFMTGDGQRMYFCSNRSLGSAAERGQNVDIWVSTRSGGGWGEARHLGPTVNSDGDDYYPTLADDGTLYLSSNRVGGLGGSDIYRALTVDGDFSAPVNLGPMINTPSADFDPFVSPDHGFLIFASERPGGLGVSDLYISFRARDGSWMQARNMGADVNSDSADFTPMLTPDGKFLFLTSDRNGASDLYWIDAAVIEDLRAKHGPCKGRAAEGEPDS
jgi:Tol biopolymer transport system component